MIAHCADLASDRAIGSYWENQFCAMALGMGKCLTPHQLKRECAAMAYGKIKNLTLPDVTVWSMPGEHYEIKHKNPTRHNTIGLELYRYEALEMFKNITGQSVYYTIHNHDLSEGRHGRVNDITHWFVAEIQVEINKNNSAQYVGPSYVNGKSVSVPILYWDFILFKRLILKWLPLAPSEKCPF